MLSVYCWVDSTEIRIIIYITEKKILTVTTTVPTSIKGHAKVSGPKRFVHSGKVKTHLVKVLHGVSIGFQF